MLYEPNLKITDNLNASSSEPKLMKRKKNFHFNFQLYTHSNIISDKNHSLDLYYCMNFKYTKQCTLTAYQFEIIFY